MVQANNRKLENIEMFLENLGSKIESFLTGSDSGAVTKAKRRKVDVVRETSPLDSDVCVCPTWLLLGSLVLQYTTMHYELLFVGFVTLLNLHYFVCGIFPSLLYVLRKVTLAYYTHPKKFISNSDL